MAAQIPPGGTYLDTFKKSFVDVKPDADKENAIPTSDFLDASESLTTIFGMFPQHGCSLSIPEETPSL